MNWVFTCHYHHTRKWGFTLVITYSVDLVRCIKIWTTITMIYRRVSLPSTLPVHCHFLPSFSLISRNYWCFSCLHVLPFPSWHASGLQQYEIPFWLIFLVKITLCSCVSFHDHRVPFFAVPLWMFKNWDFPNFDTCEQSWYNLCSAGWWIFILFRRIFDSNIDWGVHSISLDDKSEYRIQ